MMARVTIALDDETLAWTRAQAARQGVSASRFISNLLRERMRQNRAYDAAQRRFLALPTYVMNESGAPYPDRDEIHDRSAAWT